MAVRQPSGRRAPVPLPDGFLHLVGHFDAAAQRALLAEVAAVIDAAPFFRPTMPRTGQPLSVMMTNCGPLGWVSDRDGYRYQLDHPVTRRRWPSFPAALTQLWSEVTGYAAGPEACLVNWYTEGARMGLHVDADERAPDAPVVSVSLGDPALFRIGGPARRGRTRSLWLASGDVVVLGGAARHCYHGVDRVRFGDNRLLASVPGLAVGGRINLTLRRVTPPG